MVIVGTASVEFRGAIVELVYRRVDDDVTYWFADDDLNDISLLPRERQDLQRAAREISGG